MEIFGQTRADFVTDSGPEQHLVPFWGFSDQVMEAV
jgi:hypothetical protein